MHLCTNVCTEVHIGIRRMCYTCISKYLHVYLHRDMIIHKKCISIEMHFLYASATLHTGDARHIYVHKMQLHAHVSNFVY